MMKRDDCMAEIVRHHTDEILAAVYGAAFDLLRLRPHPLTFVSFGAMGLLSSQALGFALAKPERRVIVLDGDGSLLMNLGTLVTVAELAPKNFVHMVCENGTYEANGGHPTPGAGTVDFEKMAQAAGYKRTYSFSDLATFRDKIRFIMKEEEGPVFVTLKIVPGEPSPRDWKHIHGANARAAFKEALRAS